MSLLLLCRGSLLSREAAVAAAAASGAGGAFFRFFASTAKGLSCASAAQLLHFTILLRSGNTTEAFLAQIAKFPPMTDDAPKNVVGFCLWTNATISSLVECELIMNPLMPSDSSASFIALSAGSVSSLDKQHRAATFSQAFDELINTRHKQIAASSSDGGETRSSWSETPCGTLMPTTPWNPKSRQEDRAGTTQTCRCLYIKSENKVCNG